MHILGFCIKNTEWKHLKEEKHFFWYGHIFSMKTWDFIRLLYLEIVFAMFYIKFCSESNLNGKNLMTKQSFYCSNVLGQ